MQNLLLTVMLFFFYYVETSGFFYLGVLELLVLASWFCLAVAVLNVLAGAGICCVDGNHSTTNMPSSRTPKQKRMINSHNQMQPEAST